jgi:hypothetical protein
MARRKRTHGKCTAHYKSGKKAGRCKRYAKVGRK